MQTVKSALFKRVWILTDGKAGDFVQCLGVAEALGVSADIRTVSPQKPWVWMMPYGPLPPSDQFDHENSPIHKPFPDLVIASGWRTLAYIREIKKQQGADVFTVFLKSPRCKGTYLDLIWAPEHDRLTGDKVISSIAGPHRFSPVTLSGEYGQKPDDLKRLPKPLVGVLLGGDSKDYHFSESDCTRLVKSLGSLADLGAGLAITPSRRTPEALKEAIRHELEGKPIYWWDEQQPNPYGYILSHADYFVVTADSANMVGEACVTGRPVFVFKPSGGSKKFDRLLAGFEAHGATKPLPEVMEELVDWNYEPLYAVRDIAHEIEKRATRQFNAKYFEAL